jgi:hypothetical protein
MVRESRRRVAAVSGSRRGTSRPKTGPEMGLKKLSSATSQGSPCPAAPNNSSSIAPVVGVRLRSAGYPGGAVRQVMPSAQWSQISSYGSGSDRAPHCAGVLRVRSTVLRCVGGISWAANQQHGVCCRQIARGANMRPKKSALWTGEYPSATSPSSRCPARRSNSSSTARAATQLQRSAGSRVTVDRLPRQSMPSAPTSSLGSIDRRAA